MPIIKNVKRRFYSEDNCTGGLFDFAHQCKVNMNNSAGECSFVLPEHIYKCFDRHNVNSIEYFRNQMEMKKNKKSEPIVEFEAINMFEPCIDIINSTYRDLRKNELVKKVIVLDSQFAIAFGGMENQDRFEEEFGVNLEHKDLCDFSWMPFNNSAIMSHAIHFGYRVGYQVGRNIYSTLNYEVQVSPSPLIATTDIIREPDRTQKIIDWTKEREEFLRVIKSSMDKLVAQMMQFRENITSPEILEKIDKKQITSSQLMLAQKN